MIIGTEPLVLGAYLERTIETGLLVRVDRPLTTRRDVAHDVEQVLGLWRDYSHVMERYRRAQARGANTGLLVNSHRRFHPGFEHVLRSIKQARDETGCPVTNFASEHCDAVRAETTFAGAKSGICVQCGRTSLGIYRRLLGDLSR